MVLVVRLFAGLRELAETDAIAVEVPDDGATVADAVRALAAHSARLGDALAATTVVMAVNREYAGEGTPLAAGDELALIPPVSGGDGIVAARVTSEPLSADALSRAVTSPGCGAVVVFQGVTRTVESLDYEAYVPMAEARIEAILGDLLAKHPIERIAAEHRIGTVPLSEPSVVVAVGSAHREGAFAAAREAIDRIKAEAPIWKREIDGKRVEWVDGTPPPAA